MRGRRSSRAVVGMYFRFVTHFSIPKCVIYKTCSGIIYLEIQKWAGGKIELYTAGGAGAGWLVK